MGFLASHPNRHSPHSMWPQGTHECANTIISRHTMHSVSSCSFSWKEALEGPASPSAAASFGTVRSTMGLFASGGAAPSAALQPSPESLRLREPCIPAQMLAARRAEVLAPGWQRASAGGRCSVVDAHLARRWGSIPARQDPPRVCPLSLIIVLAAQDMVNTLCPLRLGQVMST